MIASDSKTQTHPDISPISRPEYPRPQFTRDDWLNLNGVWEFEFDDANVGLRENWAHSARPFTRRIRVPFAFETALSGIGDHSFHSCVWYRRKFSVPKHWSGKLLLLHFGAVDYHASVWVNGILVANHEGGHTPFECEIGGTLKKGKGIIEI